jgi:hypothetical protein
MLNVTLSNQFEQRKVEGQKAYGSYLNEVFGMFSAESDIKCGRFITFGANDFTAKEVSATTDKVMAFATHQHSQEIYDNVYPEGHHLNFVTESSMVYVKTTADVNAGDPVYIDLTTTGKIGQVTNVPTGNKRVLYGWFDASAKADEFAILSFNLTNQ